MYFFHLRAPTGECVEKTGGSRQETIFPISAALLARGKEGENSAEVRRWKTLYICPPFIGEEFSLMSPVIVFCSHGRLSIKLAECPAVKESDKKII